MADNKPCAPCVALIERDPTPEGAAGAPSFSSLCWAEAISELRVFFMVRNNQMPTWRLTTGIKECIYRDLILKWANVWSDEAAKKGVSVPKFVLTETIEDSDIRVKLGAGTAASWSFLGTLATNYLDEETMVLNLHYPDDDLRQHTVVHEFGHTLGLGHEHQMSRISNALDKEATIEWIKEKTNFNNEAALKKFNADYQPYIGKDIPDDGIDFDPGSIMCYPIDKKCFKQQSLADFTPEQMEMLTTVDFAKRNKPSRVDIVTICSLYKGKKLALPVPLAALKTGPKTAALELAKLTQLTNLQGNSRMINVAVEISMNYSIVGTALLKDDRGVIIPAIMGQYMGNPVMINLEILRRWVQGQGIDRSWGTLVRVLKSNGCGALAEDIMETLGM